MRLFCNETNAWYTRDGPWGTYSDKECPVGYYRVCGLRTNVRPYQGPMADDTGIVKFKVRCCLGEGKILELL